MKKNFQALIWSNLHGSFRVRLLPYEYGDAKMYSSDLDEASFRQFATIADIEPDGIAQAARPEQAITADNVALSQEEMQRLNFVSAT